MKIFIINHHFSAYYKLLTRFLVYQKHEVHYISQQNIDIDDVTVHPYTVNQAKIPFSYISLSYMQKHADEVYQILTKLHKQNITPDLIIGGSYYGESLYVKNVYPNTPLYVDGFFYDHRQYAFYDHDYYKDYHHQFFPTMKDSQSKNAILLQIFEKADKIITTSMFQKNSFPKFFHEKVHVVTEPILPDIYIPNEKSFVELNNEKNFTRHDEVISFFAPQCEIASGYDMFLNAIQNVLTRRKNAKCIIIGGHHFQYNLKLEGDISYKSFFLHEIGNNIDHSRVHFVGHIPFHHFLSVLQISTCFCMLSYPFPVTRDLLEAMSVATPIVASQTDPINEFITHSEEGLLIDFFSPSSLSEHIIALLENRDIGKILGNNARKKIIATHSFKDHFVLEWQKLLKRD